MGFCSGAVSSLVAITPGSGFVGARESLWPNLSAPSDGNIIAAAVAFGVVAGTFCNWATQLKFIFGWDDTLDVRNLLPIFLFQP